MTSEDLEAEFAARGTIRGGLLLLEPRDAIELVRRARGLRIPVLGIDAFRLSGRHTQPDQELSVDYSRAPASAVANVWEDAERFLLARLDTDRMFEVTLG